MNAVAKQERIAFHESGHAAIHHYFLHPLESVAISESNGHCKTVAQWDERPTEQRITDLVRREALLETIMAGLAGKVVMDRLRFQQWTKYVGVIATDHKFRASHDYERAFKMALELNDGDSLGAELLMA